MQARGLQSLTQSSSEIEDEKTRCCASPHLVTHAGFLTCTNCGTCVEEVIVNQPVKIFEKTDRIQHSISTTHQRTVMSDVYRPGNNLSPKWRKLNKINYWFSEDCKFHTHRSTFLRVSGARDLPEQIKRHAYNIYLKSWRAGFFKSHNATAMAVGALFCACEHFHVPVTLVHFIGLDRKSQEGKQHISAAKSLRAFMGTQTTMSIKKLIISWGSKLGFTPAITRNAADIYLQARKKGFNISGKSRDAIAAAALYISQCILLDKPLKQSRFCTIIRTTEITLRARIRELLSNCPEPLMKTYQQASHAKARRAQHTLVPSIQISP